MRHELCRSLAILLCTVGWHLSATTPATSCDQQQLPVFDAKELEKPPGHPNPPLSLETIEIFRAELELYRENVVEEYNSKLIAYGDELDAVDKTLRRMLASGKCTLEQYDAVRAHIEIELRKNSFARKGPYRKGKTLYDVWIEWCKKESSRIIIRNQIR